MFSHLTPPPAQHCRQVLQSPPYRGALGGEEDDSLKVTKLNSDKRGSKVMAPIEGLL